MADNKDTKMIDSDPIETREWLDALSSIIQFEGPERAAFILQSVIQKASESGIDIPAVSDVAQSDYCNTLAEDLDYPGDIEVENKITALNRWNMVAMVMRAKQKEAGLGGHISSYSSIASLYEVGMNHIFKAPNDKQLGDIIYYQGHSAEGNYARAYLEGRLTEDHLLNFRQEVDGKGISSYPHPWLMPEFWENAVVSLGLGPLQAIYQARFMKYMENRGLLDSGDRHVWVYAGDGEMDEPESIAGLTLASREKLDNITYVINCNLQRLDGLVRSNYKVIQEYDRLFRGAGWNVIKVVWGSLWDELFAKDKNGILQKRLNECVDGDIQAFRAQGPAYFREHFFGVNDALAALVADYSDDQLRALALDCGGHDLSKVYSAYQAAVHHKGQPTVIIFQTIKGYGFTGAAESKNVAHNQIELNDQELKAFRDRFNLPLKDSDLKALNFHKPKEDSEEIQYVKSQRKKLGGYLPQRRSKSDMDIKTPSLEAFEAILKGSGDRTMSTTMALGRILNVLLKDKAVAKHIVPIFSDETRTFGLEALFRQIGIYSPVGQLYTSEDASQLVNYREAKDGQLLQEGITEAGCMASWLAAATSYSNHNLPMIPFFVYYSMFGFQRVGDLIWAGGDMRARGFLIGGTAGRTTLAGEGLQHQDGHTLLAAFNVPTCRSYDPTYAYEMAVIIQDGLRRMYQEQEDIFYYIMAMNEKYEHPAMPKGVEEGILKGMYLLKSSKKKAKNRVQLFGSGAILREAIAASELLEKDFSVAANVWSVTSFNELRRDGVEVERYNRLNPTAKKPKQTYVEKCLNDHSGPVIAATDYIRNYADQIREYIPNSYTVVGTDGFGRSDDRPNLRRFFEVDRFYIAVSALYALAQEGNIPTAKVQEAIKKYGIDPKKPNPMTV